MKSEMFSKLFEQDQVDAVQRKTLRESFLNLLNYLSVCQLVFIKLVSVLDNLSSDFLSHIILLVSYDLGNCVFLSLLCFYSHLSPDYEIHLIS